MDCSLINEESSVFLRNQHVTQNRLSFAGSQTLLASENELNSTGSFNSEGTVGDARRLHDMICAQKLKSFFCKCNPVGPKIQWKARFHCLHFLASCESV